MPTSVTDQVAGGGVNTSLFVPTETSTQVSNASSQLGSYFGTVNGTALTSGGKPEVLYLGGEYCPYCAAQRWAMVNALSRFGTFSGLTTTHSSSTDVDPNTPTWTFYKSTYTSNYLVFTPVEEYTNYRIGNTTNTNTTTRRCRPRRRPSSRSGRPTTRRARSPSSTSATSTSRSATSRRSARRCCRARPGPRSARP